MNQHYRRQPAPFPGYLYCPTSPGPHPGILLLHGSEGGGGDFWGFPDQPPFPVGEMTGTAMRAKRFASMGYATYAFSYFFAEKGSGSYECRPPEELAGVEIENTIEALAWLRQSEWVQGLPVGLYGGSRGAELALVLAAERDQLKSECYPDAIVASAPPDKVFPAFTKKLASRLSNNLPITDEMIMELPSAWTIGGEPIVTGLDIAVENITTPLLAIYGAKDELWGPSINPANLYLRHKKYKNSGFELKLSKDFEETKAVTSLMGYWRKTKPESVSTHLCFEDEGHAIRLESAAGQLINKVLSNFFHKYLK